MTVFDRIWWLLAGIITGIVITVRALRRRPAAADFRDAALSTGADALEMTAHIVRPKANR